MRHHVSLLVTLVTHMDRLPPWPSDPARRPRGRPNTCSDWLILKVLVIMIIRCVNTACEAGYFRMSEF
jgi:hypothetical protein